MQEMSVKQRVWRRFGWEKCILFSPLILSADLILFLGSEIVLNVKGLTNLLGRFAFDHIRDGFTANVQESLDVKEIGSLTQWMSQSNDI